MRVVLDANVLVSGFPTGDGVPGVLVEQWIRNQYELVTSQHVISGVQRAWRKPYFRQRYPAQVLADAAALLRRRASIVKPADDVRGVADDEEDDLVLATAVAGQADYLVTGDNGLLRLGTFRDIQIISPRDFLSLLEARARVDPT